MPVVSGSRRARRTKPSWEAVAQAVGTTGGRPDGEHGSLDGLPPILDDRVQTLILGSFPSPASLAAQQYYAHRHNQFWPLLATVLGEQLTEASYLDKQCALLRHGIGVWDVYRRCRREGSLDSAIRAAEVNDFASLSDIAPRLSHVCFNGQTAGRLARWFGQRGYRTTILPSSSPAYTLGFAAKLERWQTMLEQAR